MKSKFFDNLEKKEYIEFYDTLPEAHFLQSYEFGQAKEKSGEGNPIYVGLKDEDGNILCATMLLKIILPLNKYYFYAPRGFLIDYSNKKLFQTFSLELKKYIKQKKALYLKVNPYIVFHYLNENGERMENDLCNETYEEFINNDFHHLGFNKLFENKLHRFTFRINLKKNFSEIESNMTKSFMKLVKKSYKYDLEIIDNKDIDTFYKLLDCNQTKLDFHKLTFSHYQNLFNEFDKRNRAKLFNVVINPPKLKAKLENEKAELENQITQQKKVADASNMLNRINKELNHLESINQTSHTICSLMCVYSKNVCWTLYISNDDTGVMFNAQNRIYYEAIKYAYECKYDFIDLYGTIGDPFTKEKNYGSLYDYKRKMGGEYIEFIGEFDLINNIFMYKLLNFIKSVYYRFK